MLSLAFNLIFVPQVIKFILGQICLCNHAGAYFKLVERIGFEFKFSLNSNSFECVWRRKDERNQKRKGEEPNQPKGKKTQPSR